MRPESPRVARLLVSLATRRANRRSVVQDLREEFHSMLAEGVPLADARGWDWNQVIDSVLPLIPARRCHPFRWRRGRLGLGCGHTRR